LFFFLILVLLLVVAAARVSASGDFPLRDTAVADRYARWASGMIESGQWEQALAGLERAADFADVSSDISYLLAHARLNQNRSRALVLEALNKALHVNRWNAFDREAALLFRAETLINIRAHGEALADLSRVRSSPREAALRLRALAASRPWEFFNHAKDVLDLYPREPELARIFFRFLNAEHRAGRVPGRDEMELLELVIRRLPALLLHDRELAWMAAPFIWDRDEARRLVLAYRAINIPAPQSIPAALRLGVIGEEAALEEIFSAGVLDRGLLDEVWEILGSEQAISLFRRNLSAFTGVIIEDADGDGVPETFAEYIQGMLTRFTYDATQDGVPNLTVYFEAGVPVRGFEILLPEGFAAAGRTAAIQWERYPAVLEVELDGVRYIPRPFDFHYSPFVFNNLWDSSLLFPERDPLTAPLTRRILVFNALRVERPSLEFSGGVEIVDVEQGIPIRAREFVGELMVSETEFFRGRPQLQRVDLTLAGRMDTVRIFRGASGSGANRPMELEDLWDYNGEIEYTVSGVERLHD